ncbi:MAG: helix-turn-helix transcriptional regulator [Ignavibacteriae bacterium]|nr:helix-turn-helix transcriptional regulator [Ignavibacteriota bacterium]
MRAAPGSMPLTLSIRMRTDDLLRGQVIEFFSADEWSQENEDVLLRRLQDVLAAVRFLGTALHLDLNIEVTDAEAAEDIIRSKLERPGTVHPHKLSLREIEVLGHIMNGLTNQEIADTLFISYETVKSHRKNILAKTGARNTAALVSYYHQTFFDK